MNFSPGYPVFTGGPYAIMDIEDRRLAGDATGWVRAPTLASVEALATTFPGRIMIPSALAAVPTTQRPTAAHGLFAGMSIYDTTLGLPIFWDGAAWRNAAGVAV